MPDSDERKNELTSFELRNRCDLLDRLAEDVRDCICHSDLVAAAGHPSVPARLPVWCHSK